MPSIATRFAFSSLKWQLAAIELQIKLVRFIIALKAYNPEEPRISAGNPGGGRWTRIGGIGRAPSLERAPSRQQSELAEGDIGTLISELRYPGGNGRKCVYKFSFGSVIVEGPRYAACKGDVFWFEVTHGQILNDN
jgi:hypothetical protein